MRWSCVPLAIAFLFLYSTAWAQQPGARWAPSAPALGKVAASADTTLRFYDISRGGFVFDLGGDARTINVIFRAPVSGMLSAVAFPLYNGILSDGTNAAGIAGAGTLRVKLHRLMQLLDPTAHPLGVPGEDSLDITFAALEADEDAQVFNTLVLDGFHVTADSLYSIGLHLLDDSEDARLTFLFDRGSTNTLDSRYYVPFLGGGARTGFFLTGASAAELNGDGIYFYSGQPNVLLDIAFEDETATAVERREASVPAGFHLAQNYPNPFNPATTIAFDLPEPGHTTLRVYDLRGRMVAELVNTPLSAGAYRVRFEAAGLPSGAYLYRLEAGTFVQQRLLTLVR